jgi:hypothetical protein
MKPRREPLNSLRLYSVATVAATGIMLLSFESALAQQGPPGCNWKKYLYAHDAVQQGKIDTNILNQTSAPGFSPGLLVYQ